MVDERGDLIGRIDRLALEEGGLTAEGWTTGTRVGILQAHGGAIVPPTLVRQDVNAALHLPSDRHVGFYLRLPHARGPAHCVVVTETSGHVYPLRLTASWRQRLGQAAAFFGFLLALAVSVPDALLWRVFGSAGAKARIKRRLGIGPDAAPSLAAAAPIEIDAGEPLRAPADTEITIVLPVYNAFDLLPEVLDRIAAHTDLPWHLVAIEDRSTDAQVRPWLRDRAAALGADRVTLLENEENLGFIRSVNRGFEVARARGAHVVLLNSDAFLPEGWASRLLAPLVEGPKVATVTPMSNDAEIFTVPAICVRNSLEPGEVDLLDRAAARLGGPGLLAEAPTGVGFCMAIHRDALAEEPAFDTAFGRGYGEEVDWCQKLRARGWQHLGHGGVFVEHRGGQSFGSEAKLALVRENNARVAGRYPYYDAEVQRYIHADPMRSARLALGLALVGARGTGPVPVYLTHALGGGAQMWLDREVRADLDRAGGAVILRVGGSVRWQVELHTADGVTSAGFTERAALEDLLRLLPRRRMVYSCGVGDPDPVELPGLLTVLADGAEHRLDVLFHDFFPVSPSYTLLGSDGLFHGVPPEDSDDPAHRFVPRSGAAVPLAEWRRAWGAMLAAADEIVVFAEDGRRHVAVAWPELAGRITVRPHRLLHEVPRCPPGTGWRGRPVIGVLGNIGYQKGAAVLADASRRLAESGAARLVVIGNIDPAYPLAPPAHVHGDYRVEDLPRLIAEYGVGCWWIPSIWPETFSFATREALATGLPVWAFDLGAQGEAVAAAAARGHPGGTLPVPATGGAGAPALDAILNSLEETAA